MKNHKMIKRPIKSCKRYSRDHSRTIIKNPDPEKDLQHNHMHRKFGNNKPILIFIRT